jgi:YD repeat-containing protein
MKRLFTAIALPLLLFGLTAAQKVPDRDAEDLLGPVRSVNSRITTYLAGDSNQQGHARQLDLVSYDDEGNEAERTIYDDYGFLGGRQVNKRDSDGHLIESILSDPEGAVMERVVYAYSDGKLAETVHYDGKGEVLLREVDSYDGQGRLSEVIYHAGNEGAAKTVYRYDEEGRGSEAAFFLADGSRAVATIGPCLGAHRMTYSYDERGRSHKVVAYEPDGKMKKSWLYAYNDKGQMAEEKQEDDWSSTTSVYAYEYDAQGNWIERTATVTVQLKDKADEIGPDRSRTIYSRKIAYY